MARLLATLAFVAISLAFAQGADNTTSASMSVTVTPTSSSSMAHSSTPAVSPTPTPSPQPAIPNNTYTLHDSNNDKAFCLRMVAGMAINFTYLMENGKLNYTMIDFNRTAKVADGSSCTSTKEKSQATLKLQYMPEGKGEKEYYVSFEFAGNTSGWHFKNLSVDFTYDPADFPNYKGPALPTDIATTTYTNDTLFEEGLSLLSLNTSFQCNSNRTIFGFKPVTVNNTLNVTFFVKEFRVQAFHFKNESTGAFDDASQCRLDNPNTGNKIVPIAVGAALAGLVIVVLIAYLIGRLRNRRKSSYEALS